MRILHVFKTYWPDTFGGVERVIHALAKGSVAHDIQSDILTLSPSPSPEPIAFDGHRIHQVKLDLDIASTGLSRAAFGAFSTLSAEADIVHYHFPWPFMDLLELATRHGKPRVVTYHSDIVKQKLLLRAYAPLMHSFLGRAEQIVATSPNYAESSPVLQRYRNKTRAIPLGLEENDYPPPSEARLEHWRARFPEGFFLFVGVLRYYKGIHILFQATKQTGLPVIVVGGNGIEDELKAQCEKEAVNSFHMLGPLPDEDKIALLSLCRALVFPSHLRSEAFGLSLVEAAMFGKPMISCEIGTGTSYVNLNGETGLVIAPEQPDQLASAMRRLSSNQEEAARFGAAARQRYLTHFKGAQMVNAYAEIYRSLA